LLGRVVNRLRCESEAEGKVKVFELLKPFLTADKGAIPYATAATALGWTEGAVRVTVHRLRRRYRLLLRDEISQTLADPSQAENELQSLMSAFA
jgi:RNA polymerase sigma-70 factor (ECF subfamily)